MDEHARRPALTAVVPAVDDYATILEVLRAVEDQTAIADVELLLVSDSLERLAAPADFAARHPRARVIEARRPLLLNEARTIGIERASADFVLLLEDHCLPMRDCMARIIERAREGRWAVVGPGFESANRCSAWGHAANLLTYGEWMGYGEAEERSFVSGYSSAWRRESLKRLASHLEREIAIPSRLQQRLRRSGERLCFEPRAVMLHWEASYPAAVARILFRQGLAMGVIRRGDSPAAARLWASLLVPGLALHRALRGVRAWLRTRPRPARALVAIPALALVWCGGELAGYWTRDAAHALRDASDVERRRQPFIDAAREPIQRPWADS